MTSESPFNFKLVTSESEVEGKEMKSDFEMRKQHKFYWIISFAVFFIVILVVMSIISVIICKRRRERGGRQIMHSDNTMLPLSQHLMEESSVNFSM